ncbi:amino acid permease [Fictibacillus nanhaiensis]|uniref:amino acid permease n=1 Tax=Fictibacillus nanhaiensis TaxID=742169 RepID=UPI001C945769|nr:amino acid permease [Fictibacillus nanhaiensis]
MVENPKNGAVNTEGHLAWWQLSLIGIGCIIGTGYFLGSAVAIKLTGPSVVFSYLAAAVGTFIVYDVLARMSAADPQKGSFCAYSKNAFGHWAGFSCGWVYWISEMLISGSQLTALSIFARFWFPTIPMWVFAVIFSVLGLAVVLAGTKGFERAENIFAVIKIAAIFMFILLATLVIYGWFGGESLKLEIPDKKNLLFPNGVSGWWSSLIFAFYAFGGIEIMGLMAIQLKEKNDAPKAGSFMLIMLAIIYMASISLALLLISWRSFEEKQSPFITALEGFDLAFFPHVFNGALIIAGFSTMTASLFAVTNILMTLSETGDAPKIFTTKMGKKRKVPVPALGLTAAGLLFSIFLALLMPGKVYEYITTAAGLMLLYNWCFILLASRRLLKKDTSSSVKYIVGIVLILAAISGTAMHDTSRMGLFFSLGFIAVISLVLLKMKKKWENNKKSDSPL